jgi:hypothetical protein
VPWIQILSSWYNPVVQKMISISNATKIKQQAYATIKLLVTQQN